MMSTGEEKTQEGMAPKSPPMTRALTAAVDPARRLQELLREQTAGEEFTPAVAVTPTPVLPTQPVADIPDAAPPAVHTDPVETVRLAITLDGARLDAVEYAGREALPTRLQLEQMHRAYIFRDQWSKSDTTPTWTVHMKRKSR